VPGLLATAGPSQASPVSERLDLGQFYPAQVCGKAPDAIEGYTQYNGQHLPDA